MYYITVTTHVNRKQAQTWHGRCEAGVGGRADGVHGDRQLGDGVDQDDGCAQRGQQALGTPHT